MIAFVVRYEYREIIHELFLEREEQRLLTANAPSAVFPSMTVPFTPNGEVMLPDGRAARLAEINLSDLDDRKRLSTDVVDLLHLIKAQKIGYTVTSFDVTGLPVVHLWALSPNEYGALCGNSGPEERRRLGWLLWRNVNYKLMDDKGFGWNGNQSERAAEHTKVND